MQRLFIAIIVSLLFSATSQAQTDSLLLSLQDTTPKTPLLPSRMIFTQRFLWGEKGLMRKTGIMPLNEQNRKRELKIRRIMLVSHQGDGYLTLACMIAQGIIGSKLYSYPIPNKTDPNYSTYRNLRSLHDNTAIAVDVTYFSTAIFSLFAPPPLINRKTKLNSIRLHKILAMIHFPAMVAVNILADDARKNPAMRVYHRDAAYTAFAAFGLAVIVMKF